MEAPVEEQTKTADSSEQGQTPVEQVKQDMSETGEYSSLIDCSFILIHLSILYTDYPKLF